MSINLKTEKVIKEWTDYNGHLNVAFYVHIFDIAADVMLDNFKMGGVGLTRIFAISKCGLYFCDEFFLKNQKYL